MSAPDVQSVLCVGSSETSNNRDIGLNLSPSFSRKYANYTPWPTPCEVAVEMQTMASCEHLAAATQGWSTFDWAEHCLMSSPQFLYHKFLVSLIRFQEQAVAYQARGVA